MPSYDAFYPGRDAAPEAPDTGVSAAQAVAAGFLAFAGLVSAAIIVGTAVAASLPSLPAGQAANLHSLQGAVPTFAFLAAVNVIAAAVLVAGPAAARRVVAVLALGTSVALGVGAGLVAAGFDPIGRPGTRLDGAGILAAAALAYLTVAWLAARQRAA